MSFANYFFLCCCPRKWPSNSGEEGKYKVGLIHHMYETLGKTQGKGVPDGNQYTKALLGPVIAQNVGTWMLPKKAAEEQEGRKED